MPSIGKPELMPPYEAATCLLEAETDAAHGHTRRSGDRAERGTWRHNGIEAVDSILCQSRFHSRSHRLLAVKTMCQKIRSLNVMPKCRDAQLKICATANQIEAYGDQMAEAVDTLDVNTIHSAGRHLQRGSAMIESLGESLHRLKRKNNLE